MTPLLDLLFTWGHIVGAHRGAFMAVASERSHSLYLQRPWASGCVKHSGLGGVAAEAPSRLVISNLPSADPFPAVSGF